MTYQTDCTLPDSLLEQIAEQGLNILPELVRIVINTAMQAEREQYLGAAAYERTDTRRGHANGYKPKTVTTRVGPVTFDVPQVREGGFYPEALERGLRTERALMTTLAEMYVQGVSTRKVAAITEQLCGTAISSAQVSRAAALLDEELTAWRNRHNRRGWVVELTYTQLADAEYWGIDDLARRVEASVDKGLLVLVRVDYDQGQSIPPPADYLALDAYLTAVQRLARDDRLSGVHGYVVGSGFNTREGNSQSPGNKVTPEWYARVLNGYDTPVERTDNVIQTIRSENPAARILVGPISPWHDDQTGALLHRIDVPWLNYFNTLVIRVNEATQERASAGIALAAPDGFAVQASGWPDAPELAGSERVDEPRIDLRQPPDTGAQAGFRVYQDWLDVINAHPDSRGLPVYITSTNTFQRDDTAEPAQNYPPGWLTAALDVVNREPQIAALCWYLDAFPHDDQWDFFSLTNPRGLMVNAADEFDSLLRLPSTVR